MLGKRQHNSEQLRFLCAMLIRTFLFLFAMLIGTFIFLSLCAMLIRTFIFLFAMLIRTFMFLSVCNADSYIYGAQVLQQLPISYYQPEPASQAADAEEALSQVGA